MFGRRPGVDLSQKLLHPPQDAHLQGLILLGHQRRLVPARFERRDSFYHRRGVHVPLLYPQRIDAHWPFLCPQPLHVALRAGVQLRVAVPTCIRGWGVVVQMRLGSVVELSAEGAAGRGCRSGGIRTPGKGRGWSHTGRPTDVGTSRLWSWRQEEIRKRTTFINAFYTYVNTSYSLIPSNVGGISPLVPSAAPDLNNFNNTGGSIGGGGHLFGSIFSGGLINTGCSGEYLWWKDGVCVTVSQNQV